MALFKISKGKSENLPANKVDGYCYVTTDDGKFYVDYKKDDGTLDRFALNAVSADQWKTARNLNGMVVNGTSNVVNYGTCSTASATAAKVVSCPNFALITGAEITVKFTTANMASSPTLNVNNTGAKAIYYRGSAISAGYLDTNRTYTFRYNGSQYDLVGDLDTNTDTKVTQAAAITTNGEYPVILGYNTKTTAVTNTVNKASTLRYNPSTKVLTTTTFKGALSGNASTASKVNNKLTVGSKTFDGSEAVTIAASDLGLASAMLFLGTTTTAITDGATTNPITVDGASKTVTAGNVVLYENKEFAWTGSAWEELGNEGSYKIVQEAIADPSASGTSNTFIATISQDTNGKITVSKKTVAVTNSAPTLSWETTSTIGTVAGTNLQVKMPANPNTDTKVKQTVTTSNATYPLLLAPNGQTATTTTNAYFDSGVTLNPSTNTIAANISGNAATASSIAWDDITGKPSTYTPASHTHDDRYYTESEIDSKLDDKAPSSHTHNYAGSSSAGGVATSSYSLQSKEVLDTQDKIDSFLTVNKVKYATFKSSNNIGMAANDGMILSLPFSSANYGAQIAFDDSKTGLVKIRGKASSWGDWYTLLHSGNYTSYAVGTDGSGASGTWDISISGNAATADKLGTTTVGSGTKPIYLNAGVATASSSTVGGAAKPVYMSSGTITACSSTVGSGTKPVYMSSGTITASSSTVGSSKLPVYMSSGTITKCSTTLGVSITGNAATATKATQDGNGDVISSTYLPLAGGTMTGTIITPADDSIVIRPARNNCDRIGGNDYKFWKIYATTFHGDLSGNASTATKLKTARTINSISFDGTEDITFAGSYKTNTEPKSLPQGLSFIELPPTAVSTGDPTYGTCLTVAQSNTSRAFQLCVNNKPDVYVRAMHTNFTSTTVPGYSEWYQVWRKGNSVTGAVWNDYAECRKSNCEEFGYVLMENGDDTLSKTTERLSHFAGVSSDTWGFSQGETDKAKTPIAVAGRVLVYPYQDRNNYKPGDCVCAAPGGTVDIMTREEVREWPDRIVGIVSCVPDYEEWGGGEGADRAPVKVDGRIWIKVV